MINCQKEKGPANQKLRMRRATNYEYVTSTKE